MKIMISEFLTKGKYYSKTIEEIFWKITLDI
jgi:hypothetical protein